jgi:ankyrin repeat protein
MKKHYLLPFLQAACFILISLLLQSCGGRFDNNPIIPIREKQPECFQDELQPIISLSNIEPLIRQDLTAEGGYLINPYEYKGNLQASVEIADEKDKVYNGIPIKIEEGIDLASLPYLPKTIQERYIRPQFDKNHHPIGACLYQAQLIGEKEREGENEEKEEKADKHIMSAYIERLINTEAKEHIVDERGNTALHIAIKQVNILLGERLASKGLDISYLKGIDQGSLQYLCIGATKQEYFQAIIDSLIDKGADIEARNKDKETPLHIAAKEGHTKIVQYLIDKGADKQARAAYYRTPLHLAAERGYIAVVQCLIEKGAGREAKEYCNQTPLHLAARNGHTEVAKYLVKQEANTQAKDRFNNTPLHNAARNGHLDIVKLLLDKEAEAGDKDNCGRTPLHLAALYGPIQVIQLLLEKGADREAKDKDGKTLLHLAAYSGQIEIVKMLIDQGADKRAKDNNGRKAIDQARERDHQAVVDILSRN